MPSLIAAGAAVLSILGLAAASSGASQSPSVALLALDTDTSGNEPRIVASIEECVSATVGEPVDIDIVVPSPGIPADRGVAAYQFSILYDPALVWITADDNEMLLAQAAGSNVIAIADPKPDNNGVYQSWGVDFGTSGIEPAGSSETGPGVIARITLLPQSDGVSALILSNVLIIDDDSERITLESVQSATIHVSEPCPEPSQDDGVDDGQDGGVDDGQDGGVDDGQDDGVDDGQDGGVDDGQDGGVDDGQDGGVDDGQDTGVNDDGDTGMQEGAANGVNDDGDTDGNGAAADVAAAPSPSPAGGAATGVGSLAPAATTFPVWAAIIAALGGAGLLIAGKLAFRARAHRDTFRPQD
jgi:hypothetical protein